MWVANRINGLISLPGISWSLCDYHTSHDRTDPIFLRLTALSFSHKAKPDDVFIDNQNVCRDDQNSKIGLFTLNDTKETGS